MKLFNMYNIYCRLKLYLKITISKFYLSIYQTRPKSRYRGVGAHQRQRKREEGKTSEKSEEKERDRGPRTKPPPPSRATDAFIGNEEQIGKKRTRKNKMGTGPNPVTLDHLDGSYDPHRSEGGLF